PTSVILINDSAFFGSVTQIYQIHVQDGKLIRKSEMGKTILNISPSSDGFFVITDRIHNIDAAGRARPIAGFAPGQKPFKVAESRSCYIATDDLYSVLCIRK